MRHPEGQENKDNTRDFVHENAPTDVCSKQLQVRAAGEGLQDGEEERDPEAARGGVRHRASGELQHGDRPSAQAGAEGKLCEGPQGDLRQREDKPKEGEDPCGEGVVLQEIRS